MYCVPSFWMFSTGFPVGSSDFIRSILKAPSGMGETVDLPVPPHVPSQLVSYHLLSHPGLLSSPVTQSVSKWCRIPILSLESGLAFSHHCYQFRTSARLPAAAAHPGSSQLPESSPSESWSRLSFSLLKAPGGSSPGCSPKLTCKAHPRTGFRLLQLLCKFLLHLDLNCLCFLVHTRKLGSVEPVVSAAASALRHSTPCPSPP